MHPPYSSVRRQTVSLGNPWPLLPSLSPSHHAVLQTPTKFHRCFASQGFYHELRTALLPLHASLHGPAMASLFASLPSLVPHSILVSLCYTTFLPSFPTDFLLLHYTWYLPSWWRASSWTASLTPCRPSSLPKSLFYILDCRRFSLPASLLSAESLHPCIPPCLLSCVHASVPLFHLNFNLFKICQTSMIWCK